MPCDLHRIHSHVETSLQKQGANKSNEARKPKSGASGASDCSRGSGGGSARCTRRCSGGGGHRSARLSSGSACCGRGRCASENVFNNGSSETEPSTYAVVPAAMPTVVRIVPLFEAADALPLPPASAACVATPAPTAELPLFPELPVLLVSTAGAGLTLEDPPLMHLCHVSTTLKTRGLTYDESLPF